MLSNAFSAALRSSAMVCVVGAASFAGSAAAQNNEPIKPIPVESKLAPEMVKLGEQLFNDKRLSRDNSMSCASCHNLARGGIDNLATSIGIGGAKGPINAPTVFNSALSFRQFWDGRANTLEEQTAGPVHNPVEMGSNWVEVLGKLNKDATLVLKIPRRKACRFDSGPGHHR